MRPINKINLKKLLFFVVIVCTSSYVVNLISGFKGEYTGLYERISLISSTIAWFSLLLTLYFIAARLSKNYSLKLISIVLLAAISLPLYQVFSTSSQSIESASSGLLPAVFEFLNYAWRILLALISISVLMRKPVLFRVSLMLMLALVINSFCFRVSELIQMINLPEKPGFIFQFSEILDPVAILLFLLLILYVVGNREIVSNAIK